MKKKEKDISNLYLLLINFLMFAVINLQLDKNIFNIIFSLIFLLLTIFAAGVMFAKGAHLK